MVHSSNFTFDVEVADPFPPADTDVCNAGVVTATGGISEPDR